VNPEDAKSFKELHKFAAELKKRIRKAEKNLKPIAGAGTMHKIIPEARRPTAMIDRKVTDKQSILFENIRAAVNDRPDRVCHEGTFTRLLTKDKDGGWEIMMTDAPSEIRTSGEFIKKAHGDVLVAGLGLGVTLMQVLKKRAVKSVTVVELNPDVIKLVHPYLIQHLPPKQADKLRVIRHSIFTYKPDTQHGENFDTIWLDIWPDVSESNLPEMKLLKKRAEEWLNKNNAKSWLGVWEWDYLHKRAGEDDENERILFGAVGGRSPPPSRSRTGRGSRCEATLQGHRRALRGEGLLGLLDPDDGEGALRRLPSSDVRHGRVGPRHHHGLRQHDGDVREGEGGADLHPPHHVGHLHHPRPRQRPSHVEEGS
jgi:hypothetical protein